MEIKSITQEEGLGCGVSCVAFILGISYFKALKKFDRLKETGANKYYYCKDIVDALKKDGRDILHTLKGVASC